MAREASLQTHLSYHVKSAADFNYDPMKVREAIYNNKAFSAIVANPNASTLLREAVTRPGPSYDPKDTCQTIYVEARDQVAINSYIIPELHAFQDEVSSTFAKIWVPEVLARQWYHAFNADPTGAFPCNWLYHDQSSPFRPITSPTCGNRGPHLSHYHRILLVHLFPTYTYPFHDSMQPGLGHVPSQTLLRRVRILEVYVHLHCVCIHVTFLFICEPGISDSFL